jgi:hypothetical protein
LSSASATAGLARLRQEALPQVLDAPRFGSPQGWIEELQALISRYTTIAGLVAAVALLIALAVPAWAALQPQPTASRLGTISSSVGVTGTAGTRVADLSPQSFIGGIPFVQQGRVLDVSAGAVSAPQRFVLGGRQASVADYVQNIGLQMVLPYLNDAATIKTNVEAWNAAIAQQQASASIAGSPVMAAFQTPGFAPGTVIPGARATFYSCFDNGFCGAMYNGQQVFPGAAACSWNLPLGTRFFLNADPARSVYTCLDRGVLAASWVDIWFYDSADGWAWQSMIGGTYSDITIVE